MNEGVNCSCNGLKALEIHGKICQQTKEMCFLVSLHQRLKWMKMASLINYNKFPNTNEQINSGRKMI